MAAGSAPGEGGFTLTYTMEPSDLTAMLKDKETHRFLRVKRWAFIVLMLYMAGAAAFGLYAVVTGLKSGSMLLLIGLAALILMPLFRWGQPLLSASLFFRKLDLKDKEITTHIDASGIRSEAKGVTSQFQWDSVLKVTRGPEHFFLWVNKVQAIILPLRAIAEQDEQERLWALIEDNFEAKWAA
ncbi:MAG: YcxB family protein [Pseudomonadota bacterium]